MVAPLGLTDQRVALRRRPVHLPNATVRVALLTTSAAAIAVAMHLTLLAGRPSLADPLPLTGVVLVVLFALGEVCVVHVHLRREATSFSLSDVALVIGLIFASPTTLLLSRTLGSAAALVLHRRQPWIKVAFNLASFATQTVVAVLVHRALIDGADATSLRGWMAALAATIAALAAGTLLVGLAIAATEGHWPVEIARAFIAIGLLTCTGASTVGVLAAGIVRPTQAAVWPLVGICAVAAIAYRSHGRLRADHRSLELIHEFTRRVGEQLGTQSLRALLARELCELLRAEVVELVLCRPGAPTLVIVAREGTVGHFVGEDADELVARHRRLLDGRASALYKRGRSGDSHLGDGTVDAVIVTLPGPDGTSGSLLAGNRRGDVETFTIADEQLVATLANHSSIVLSNAALVERLRREVIERGHEALHDSLTGLGNRQLLVRKMHTALAERGDRLVAVLLIDLDRFKEVNDTLGHHQGDVLLCATARRLTGALGPNAIATRLGGDEFAVLATCESRSEIDRLGATVHDVIAAPYRVDDDVLLDVGASVGIAIGPHDGSDATTLLQRADVAMYAAKEDGSHIQVYDPAIDHNSPWRLAMASELRRTVERRQLLVEYQPKADLQTGAIVGVEALARWYHPQRGFVPPEQFIALAERTGLIRELTEHVLELSLAQCRVWHDHGHDINVAVNLSVRSLHDDRLPDTIGRLLATHNLRPSALTLEITESTIIADPARTVGILNRLSSMGITLAVDDFGTGYSSLVHLKRLPVDELKIDRSFVRTMATDDNDAIIVRSTVDLARNLGLSVTAEGVEDGATWRLLQALGCHHAQGYFLSRPMTAGKVLSWLAERAEEERSIESLLAYEPAEQPRSAAMG